MLFVTGCTVVREDGRTVLWTMADARNVKLRTAKGTEFSADEIIHSRSIRAVGASVREATTVPGVAGALIP